MTIKIINCLPKDYPKVLKIIAQKIKQGLWYASDRAIIYKGKKNIYNPEYSITL
jgi:hypothetical protein